MVRNCNLELKLRPPAVSLKPMLDMLSPTKEHQQQLQQQQSLGCHGRMINAVDVTELRAREIILLASGKMDEMSKTPTTSSVTSTLLHWQPLSPNTGLSVKKSLQRFLQKRKNRVQKNSPYHR